METKADSAVRQVSMFNGYAANYYRYNGHHYGFHIENERFSFLADSVEHVSVLNAKEGCEDDFDLIYLVILPNGDMLIEDIVNWDPTEEGAMLDLDSMVAVVGKISDNLYSACVNDGHPTVPIRFPESEEDFQRYANVWNTGHLMVPAVSSWTYDLIGELNAFPGKVGQLCKDVICAMVAARMYEAFLGDTE